MASFAPPPQSNRPAMPPGRGMMPPRPNPGTVAPSRGMGPQQMRGAPGAVNPYRNPKALSPELLAQMARRRLGG